LKKLTQAQKSFNNLTAIFSAKGGVGKTTILLNLAGVLSNDKKVLIIDLDLFSGGIALCLNKVAKKTIYNFHLDMNKKNLDYKKYITKYNDNIDFVGAPRSIEEGKKIDFKTVEKLIYETNLQYDIILFDLSHIYSDLNIKVLNLVSNVLYVMTNDPVDLKNSSNMIPLLKENNNNLKVILNYSIHRERNYYTLYDIKSVINNNIDYTISHSFYNPNIDFITVRGEIHSLNTKKFYDYKIFNLIAKDIVKE